MKLSRFWFQFPLSSEMSFEKYQVLVWKNYAIQKRHYISGIFEVILPVLIVIVFTWIKSTFSDEESRVVTWNYQFQPLSSCYIYDQTLSKICYSPKSPWIEEFLTAAFNETESELESFDNAQAFDEYLLDERPRNVLGIEFDDSLKV